ncbi:glycosyltransferase [uncultured Helicobacter sp.]|uniref:glycosyltransferase n=1 Tax=uncultured Helicobacter sp. TaxID=175537 RepID=UPI003752690F
MKQLPKILQVGKFYPPDLGGIERVMQDICDAFNAQGFICDVLCSNSGKYFKLDILDSKARIYRTKSYGKLASTSVTPQMIYFLRNLARSYDILHLHLPDPMANLALICANLRDKKIILHWHSDIIKQKHLLKLYKPLQSWLLKRADTIIGTSPKYIEQSKTLQAYRHKCISIPLGTTPFAPQSLAPQSLTPKNPKRLLAMGRFVRYKGFEYAIRAMEFLPEDYHLSINGDGALKQELHNLITALRLENRVSINNPGFLSSKQLCQKYAKHGILVLPSFSKNESFGLVQIEAMSYGVPVVSCAIEGSGVDWVNEHGYSGIVVPPKDPRALARAVEQIVKNYEFYSANALRRFQAHFTKEKMIDSLKELYIRLLRGGAYEKLISIFLAAHPAPIAHPYTHRAKPPLAHIIRPNTKSTESKALAIDSLSSCAYHIGYIRTPPLHSSNPTTRTAV